MRTPSPQPVKAPVPDDLERRVIDLKGMAYFLDSAHVGICSIPENAWCEGTDKAGHDYAIVLAVEYGRIPEPDNPAYDWIKDSAHETAVMRGMEIAVCIAVYISKLGYKAHAHAVGATDVDLQRLAVLAGIASRHADKVVSPYLDENVSYAAITTDYELTIDEPLSPVKHADKGLRYWLGINGAESGAERNRRRNRPSHASRYPMEQVKRVDHPTTLILDDEVPRVPKRAAFFERALRGNLGELSRIGELVLNPYVGPRFKSVVLTTDLPLEADKPIDFGLQYFCSNCLKCARECPCDAIPVTNKKVMFNGYEIWKPDVERCTRYRVTNQKGSACGRCMKTCPLNKVVTADGPLTHKIGTWLGVNAMWLKPLMVPVAVWLDDRLGYGMRNLKKKWWLDLEVVDGVTVKPEATNQRDIDVNHPMNLSREKIAYHHASMMPPPDADGPVSVDRKAAKESVSVVETPAQALARRAKGGATPAHYIPIKYVPN